MVSTRRVSLGPLRPTVVVLVTLIVLAASYIVAGLSTNFGGPVAGGLHYLPLNADAVMKGEVWRLVTYGLLHDPERPSHLIFNGLTFYFFAPFLERRFGVVRFVLFVLGALVAGGAAVVVGSLLHIATGFCIGFSGVCEACVVAWAMWNKDQQVLMWFALPMKGIHMLILGIVMWVFDAVSTSQISAAAHFGGIVFGFAVWFFIARRNRVKLFVDEALVKLRIRRGPRLTVVPKNNDRWVN